jgi:high-affinity iron transporter
LDDKETLMVPSLLLALREGLEAALIIGLVMGVLKRTRRTDRAPIVWLGTGAAIAVSAIVGIGLYAVGVVLEGAAEKVFEGFAMLLAAGVLTWMIFWMQRQGAAVREQLELGVRRTAHATPRGQNWALFSLAFLAVVREGIELALFLTAASFSTTAGATLIGAAIGLVVAAVAGWLLFATTTRLDVGRFFQVTSLLLILFAAGLIAHGVHEFNEVGWIPAVVEHVWDLNPVLDENSAVGAILKALVGYNGNPSLTEVVSYLGYWIVILLARRTAQAPALTPAEG